MRFNQSIARFMCFSVSIFLLASPFLIGCGDSDNDLPETATVMVGISSPKVLELTDALHLIVSTDYRLTPPNEIFYSTKEEFSITQGFNQTFQLDPDDPRISVELIKPGPSGSVRLTVLFDDEVEYEELFPSGWRGSTLFFHAFSGKNITF